MGRREYDPGVSPGVVATARRVLAGCLFSAAAAAVLATSWVAPQAVRGPCEGGEDWDPLLPLVATGYGGPFRLTEGAARRFSVHDHQGRALAIEVREYHEAAVVCVLGGLQPGADYTWTIDGEEPMVQESQGAGLIYGTVAFRTAAVSEFGEAGGVDECLARVKPALAAARNCSHPRNPTLDTADTAESFDTGHSGR